MQNTKHGLKPVFLFLFPVLYSSISFPLYDGGLTLYTSYLARSLGWYSIATTPLQVESTLLMTSQLQIRVLDSLVLSMGTIISDNTLFLYGE